MKGAAKRLRKHSPLTLKQMGKEWRIAGFTGGGHIRLEHLSGAKVTVACSPSCYHADKNNRAAMRKIEAAHTES